MTNAERQRAFRARQKTLNRVHGITHLNERERFFLMRVLEQMRRDPTQEPAAMRDTATGRFVHLDA